MKNVTQEIALALLRYEPDTGKLFWRERSAELFNSGGTKTRVGQRDASWAARAWNARYAGKEVSAPSHGYFCLRIFNRSYLAHRVIWLMVHGDWPDNIDHENGDRSDNRLANLRSVTNAENRRNMKRSSRNKSGCTGVRWHKGDQKWEARVTIDGRHVRVGAFDDFDEAQAAWKARSLAAGYHPNHGRASA